MDLNVYAAFVWRGGGRKAKGKKFVYPNPPTSAICKIFADYDTAQAWALAQMPVRKLNNYLVLSKLEDVKRCKWSKNEALTVTVDRFLLLYEFCNGDLRPYATID